MAIEIYKSTEQAKGSFNAGEIKENKPVGFPQDGGDLRPYSNIFYWAHAWAEADSEIGLHPHRGFEIMSILLEGEMEHFDNKMNEWIPLKAGDVQIIRSGSGISHSELMKKGSHMFQIWFDPGLQNTLKKDPEYSDYKYGAFEIYEKDNYKVRVIKDNKGPIQMDSEGVEIREYIFKNGEHVFELGGSTVYSLYCYNGSLSLNGRSMENHDFARIDGEESLRIEAEENSKVYIIESPAKLAYKTYYELSGL